ncbi:hypothetical protein [Bradyrhizobium centrosematis]|uniref:hypothetical protein n=1 Tax=Bradyrhizobium centrosematis TaxID=1300039 RepID=UPI00216A701D|nr:hypothetical protein [Bradyrhizobium centrosematis]MCS3763093.1 hypothetical protein [Bradyrhizobium centrosematis]MCS3775760.1 hypothetical protein [Bradyrhizobium centrosematis]
MFDANGFFICAVPHRQDLHERSYQYANDFLSREEARRIAKAISRLPERLKRPQYCSPRGTLYHIAFPGCSAAVLLIDVENPT